MFSFILMFPTSFIPVKLIPNDVLHRDIADKSKAPAIIRQLTEAESPGRRFFFIFARRRMSFADIWSSTMASIERLAEPFPVDDNELRQ